MASYRRQRIANFRLALLVGMAVSITAGGPRGTESREGMVREVPAKLLIWPKRAGTMTGASIDVHIDGAARGTIANLDRQMVIDLGEVATGIHQFNLQNIGMYLVDANGGTTRQNNGLGSCSGQFYVQPFQEYYIVSVLTADGLTFQCSIQ